MVIQSSAGFVFQTLYNLFYFLMSQNVCMQTNGFFQLCEGVENCLCGIGLLAAGCIKIIRCYVAAGGYCGGGFFEYQQGPLQFLFVLGLSN